MSEPFAHDHGGRFGPLAGVRVVELAGLGPAPMAGMLLADLGAEVVRVDRPGHRSLAGDAGSDLLNRNRTAITVDLKTPAGRDVLLALVESSDALIEGFRPGVTERLGIGPDDCAAANPALVYGRMTGWGQDGPLAHSAGHDIDYIALTGALWGSGRAGERPVPPINLLGDFGGGALFLAFGVVCALLEARTSGRGQVVDAAIVDGTAVLSTMIWSMRASGAWQDRRGANLLDTGAPFYDVYACADGAFIAVGALEPAFFAELVRLAGLGGQEGVDGLGADPALEPAGQLDPRHWPAQRELFTAVFATRTRDEWAAVFEGTDACVAPVLSWREAPEHPHLAARGTYVQVDDVTQPAPAPRFSRTPAAMPRPPRPAGADTRTVLSGLGLRPEEIEKLLADGVVA